MAGGEVSQAPGAAGPRFVRRRIRRCGSLLPAHGSAMEPCFAADLGQDAAFMVRVLRGSRLGEAWPGRGGVAAAYLPRGRFTSWSDLGRSRLHARHDGGGRAGADTGPCDSQTALRLRTALG